MAVDDLAPRRPAELSEAAPLGPADSAEVAPLGPADSAEVAPLRPADSAEVAPPGPSDSAEGAALRPAEFCALQRQLVAGMVMRKKRHVEVGPVQRLKVQLLELVESADPEPAQFRAALAEAVIEVSHGPGTGPAQAVASDLEMDWNIACASPGFRTWLRTAAARQPQASST